ncbi:MAG: Biopolymer transport protein ExbD/TolR [Myxococcaceae bacterium]|nr:Biopolymer transport protein ExbD/TolR [Myxococcaceae bacterium]
MAMGTSDDGGEGFSDINITPFVDIVLVLLVIFMVTAKYMVSQSIPVDLPKASTASSGTPTLVSCSIDASQQMYIDKVPMTPEEVKSALRGKLASDAELRAIINADKAVPHGRVVELIDIIRGAGIEKFAIQTELPPSTGS